MPKQVQCSRCASYFPTGPKADIHIAGCRRYNGFLNYETWVVALWIDNDQDSYIYWREIAEECRSEVASSEALRVGEAAIELLADRLKEDHRSRAPHERLGGEVDVYCDLLTAALDEVDWVEVAEQLLAE
jgi:hypothetical protein